MPRPARSHALATLLALAALLLAGCLGPPAESTGALADRPVLTLAVQPTDNAAAIQDQATALEAFLEERVAADVEIVVPLTYMGVVEALRFGHVDAAMMSAWPSAIAAQKASADIVLAEKREVLIRDVSLSQTRNVSVARSAERAPGDDARVEPFYYSYYVVLKDSPAQSLADLRGKRIAFPSTTSTSGYVFPVARLAELDLVPKADAGKALDPKSFFGEVVLAGGYAQAWEALKSGRVDAAVIAGDVKASLYEEVLAATRIVETQGPVPSHAVVFSDDLQEPLRSDLRDAMLELKGENRDLMRKLVSAIFVEFAPTTTEQHTAGLATALATAGLRFEEKL